MNKRRIIWIELLRIFACIGVIGIHAASQHFRDVPVNTSVWAVTNFYHGINRFAVACFVMISGCLYLDRKRTWNLKKLWMHNILPIAVAYVFWQVFYALYRGLVNEGLKFGSAYFLKRFLVMISDSYFHLWYLPMLIGLLIITPMLWEIVNSKNGKQWEEYMILLYLLFSDTMQRTCGEPFEYRAAADGYRICRILYRRTLSVSVWSIQKARKTDLHTGNRFNQYGHPVLLYQVTADRNGCTEIL